MEINLSRLSIRRGPLLIPPPLVGTGFEYVSSWQIGRGRSFQIMLKKRKLDLTLEELGGFRTKLNIAQTCAIAAHPAAVKPRTHHQPALGARALPIDGAIGFER